MGASTCVRSLGRMLVESDAADHHGTSLRKQAVQSLRHSADYWTVISMSPRICEAHPVSVGMGMENASRVIKHFNPERFGWAIETDGGQCRCPLAVMTILLCYERLITHSTNCRPLPSLKLCFPTANDQKRNNI